MLSLGKIFLLVVVGLVIFFGLRAFRAMARPPASPPAKASQDVADLIRCPKCGVFYDPRDGHRC